MQKNELITIIVAVGVLIFIMLHYTALRKLPNFKILVSSFYVLIASWILTILEGFFFPAVLNLLEHIGYAISAILLALWLLPTSINQEVNTK